MIVDLLDNWSSYAGLAAWQAAFEFIKSVKPETHEDRYELQGDDLYAMVSSYRTKAPAEAAFEAHRKYIDIQAVVAGEEVIEWAPADGLRAQEPYDAEKDVVFFERAAPGPGSVVMRAGGFMVLFPQDAHAPGLSVGEAPRAVKKVVEKVSVELVRAQ